MENARPVLHSDDAVHDGMCKASSAGDDAPVAVLLKSPVTRMRRKWGGTASEELFIDPIIHEAFPFPWTPL